MSSAASAKTSRTLVVSPETGTRVPNSMDIHVEHPNGVECVAVAVDATVAELRDAVAECLCLAPRCTVLAHEGGNPLGAADGTLDVPLCDVLCSDTVQVCPPSAEGMAYSLGLECEDLAPALCAELNAGRSGGERAQILLYVLDASHWEGVYRDTLLKAVGDCPSPAVLERLLASCGDRISEGNYSLLRRRVGGAPVRPWVLRLCLRAGLPLEDKLLADYERDEVPRELLEIMLEEAPERCFDAGLLHGAVACGDDAMLERCLALGASPAGALRTAVKAGRAVSCARRLVTAGCVADTELVLAASQLGQVAWLRWLFDEEECDVDVADAGGRTALHVAGSAEVVRFLAVRGAQPDLRRRSWLSVAHCESISKPHSCICDECYECHAPYEEFQQEQAQQDRAFAEVLATWPWLVHAEDWEGRTPLRWMWERLLGLRRCGYCRHWRPFPRDARDSSFWEAVTRAIKRSHLLVTFGADVQAMRGLQTIDCVKIAVHVVRDEAGRDELRFEDWTGDSSDSESWDAAEAQDDAYESLCCRVKRSGRCRRRQTRKHKYRAWVPGV
eukprot:Rhum_TRINITY_DN15403_c0_g2::Rhum_TRINITY_DN15403_c0_g2_i8::g.155332::m.155332